MNVSTIKRTSFSAGFVKWLASNKLLLVPATFFTLQLAVLAYNSSAQDEWTVFRIWLLVSVLTLVLVSLKTSGDSDNQRIIIAMMVLPWVVFALALLLRGLFTWDFSGFDLVWLYGPAACSVLIPLVTSHRL
ncbi:hypothetical protein EK91_004462 [Salmonella enterica subsp. enterica]|nr:hypothetical protein [Salmonella enterica subsp. enterica]